MRDPAVCPLENNPKRANQEKRLLFWDQVREAPPVPHLARRLPFTVLTNQEIAMPTAEKNPLTQYPQPPFKEPRQDPPGTEGELRQKADHGEHSYKGHGRLKNKAALITGGDSGIGRAVAIAFAREGADVLVSYLNEEEDARETARWVEAAGRRAILVPGDVAQEQHCRSLAERAASSFGKIDILVNNAAYQRNYEKITDIPSEEWEYAFKVNIHAMFYLVKAALPHMPKGASIINTASINSDSPSPGLLPYATTKGAIANFTAGLAQLLAKDGIRVNSVAPGPIWTPLIPSTLPKERVEKFGTQTPFKRPGQPAELAPVYVLLASEEASYISGSMYPVTGGEPIL
jgi:NAD(P)-dependent dehydrogenase (short-subunit alcohol dehydrogenase family)